jgi:hypothetical protein
MEKIIRRDFFPDVARLERRHKLEDAIAAQDVTKIREIQAQMMASELRGGFSFSQFFSFRFFKLKFQIFFFL